MAKFKVGEKARYVGKTMGAYAIHGREAVIRSIGGPHPKSTSGFFFVGQDLWPTSVIYGVDWEGTIALGHVPEFELEKLSPKHQDADLKAADPLFIQSTLPRWLNDPVDYTKEKARERENS